MHWIESLTSCCRRAIATMSVAAIALVAAAALSVGGSAHAQITGPCPPENPCPPTACEACGPLDVMFLIDITGSMGPALQDVQASVAQIIQQIVDASCDDYQLGLITFLDDVQIVEQLAPNNAAVVTSAVLGIPAPMPGAGGPEPEASDEAVNVAVNSLTVAESCGLDTDFTGVWRDCATRIVILITDARPGECDDDPIQGTANAAQHAQDAADNGILISAVNVLNPSSFFFPDVQAVMDNYAAVTGGVSISAPNGVGTADAITQIIEACGGDVPCMAICNGEIICDPADPASVTVTFDVFNNSGIDAEYVLLTPQTPGASQIYFVPNITPVSIPNGTAQTITATIVGYNGLDDLNGVEICFTVTLLDRHFSECCSLTVCITPDCECLQVIEQTVECIEGDPNSFIWTFSFNNLTPDVLHHLYFFPPTGVTINTPGPAINYINLVPPIPAGGNSGSITVIIEFDPSLIPGDEVCIDITIHDQSLIECCSKEVCVELPNCEPPYPTGACCLPSSICDITTAGECAELGGFYQGDGVSCADVTCRGGCCLTDGSCVDVSEAMCAKMSGIYQGNGVFCGSVKCEGACCLPNGECIQMSEEKCLDNAGVFQGVGVPCDDVVCKGACCFPDGSCMEVPEPFCNEAGGIYQGNGVLCTSVFCKGGCCLPDGTCIDLTPFECEAEGGNYFGDGVFCAFPFCVIVGAGGCCLPDGTCVDMSFAECEERSGTYLGDGVFCTAPFCDSPVFGGCCLPDGTCVNMTAIECEERSGSFLGAGTLCPGPLCVSEIEGACCLGGSCFVGTPTQCASVGGTFIGGACGIFSCAVKKEPDLPVE